MSDLADIHASLRYYTETAASYIYLGHSPVLPHILVIMLGRGILKNLYG